MSSWDQIEESTGELRQALLNHKVYSHIDDLESVQLLMQSHVFAVWDFMSLLKALQRECCCVTVPWIPPANPEIARLINEIVLAEETDEDAAGEFASHFDLYHAAMQQAGADTRPVDDFLIELRNGHPLNLALEKANIPVAAQAFVRQTFRVIDSGHLPSIAASFTFGREDLLPDVFTQVISGISEKSSDSLSKFIYYLDRHVALDGDEHGPMARRLVMTLCGQSEKDWQQAEAAVVDSLQSRLALWDAMEAEMSSIAPCV